MSEEIRCGGNGGKLQVTAGPESPIKKTVFELFKMWVGDG